MVSGATEQFPIRTVSSLTGVKAVTLRAWERRYSLIRPDRTLTGHRLYTHHDLLLIRRVQELVERGVPVGRVRAMIEAEASPKRAGRGAGPWSGYLERMAAAIERFDEAELDRVHDEALSVHPVQRVTTRLLLPLLNQLGKRWNGLPGAIAEEHFFATYLRSKLGARLHHLVHYASGPKLVAACAPGELHEIGLMLFALHANGAGLRTVLLGADTPLEDVAMAQRRSGAKAVVISFSMDPAPETLHRALPNLVRRTAVPVFVGGGGAIRLRQAIKSAGATPIGIEPEYGVRRIQAALRREKAGP